DAARNAGARRALAARVRAVRLNSSGWIGAVQRLCDRERRPALAYPGRAGKDEARGQRFARDGSLQKADQPPVTDDVSKGHAWRFETNRITLVAALFLRLILVAAAPVPLLAIVPSAQAEDARPEAALLFRRGLHLDRVVGVRRACRGKRRGRVRVLHTRRRRLRLDADHAGNLLENAARRVQVAERRRLGAALEVLGVDHRSPLELPV